MLRSLSRGHGRRRRRTAKTSTWACGELTDRRPGDGWRRIMIRDPPHEKLLVTSNTSPHDCGPSQTAPSIISWTALIRQGRVPLPPRAHWSPPETSGDGRLQAWAWPGSSAALGCIRAARAQPDVPDVAAGSPRAALWAVGPGRGSLGLGRAWSARPAARARSFVIVVVGRCRAPRRGLSPRPRRIPSEPHHRSG